MDFNCGQFSFEICIPQIGQEQLLTMSLLRKISINLAF